MREHRTDDVIAIFDGCFRASHQTVLVRGEGEPVYLPKGPGRPYARVVFANDYYASALHEIAHWCIAGKRRRELEDFGYWYKPDGRNAKEQKSFELAEQKPQALEWAFSAACGKIFRFSADNLNGEAHDMWPFARAVRARLLHYLAEGFPRRAARFITALRDFYGVEPLRPAQFVLPANILEPIG